MDDPLKALQAKDLGSVPAFSLFYGFIGVHAFLRRLIGAAPREANSVRNTAGYRNQGTMSCTFHKERLYRL